VFSHKLLHAESSQSAIIFRIFHKALVHYPSRVLGFEVWMLQWINGRKLEAMGGNWREWLLVASGSQMIATCKHQDGQLKNEPIAAHCIILNQAKY